MKRGRLAVGVVAVFAFGSVGAARQTADKTRPDIVWVSGKDTLAGVKSLAVVVAAVGQGIPELSGRLDDSTMQTEAELRLREAGIVIVPPTSMVKTTPLLMIAVSVLKGSQPSLARIFIYSISVRFMKPVDVDPVGLQDNTAVSSTIHRVMPAEVWGSGPVSVLGYVGDERVDNIRQKVHDEVSSFLNDWLEMNPKK